MGISSNSTTISWVFTTAPRCRALAEGKGQGLTRAGILLFTRAMILDTVLGASPGAHT